jgi:hypothetical protein
MLMLLLESQTQHILTLRIPPSEQPAGPEKVPFCSIYWFANEYKEHRIIQNHPSTAQLSTSRLWYLSNYHDTLQAHMYPLHKLGNAYSVKYHEYYQTLIKSGTADGTASNAYLTAYCVLVKTKCIIMNYRTGTLYNQKHAVWFKHSISLTCPLCPQLDSALHILSGC